MEKEILLSGVHFNATIFLVPNNLVIETMELIQKRCKGFLCSGEDRSQDILMNTLRQQDWSDSEH